MDIRYREWLFLLSVCGVGTLFSNFLGYGVSFTKSLPGVLILIAVTMMAVFLTRVIPVKIPLIAYCSILGLILALPISPIHELVNKSADAIAFAAPFTIVGAFAGIAVSDRIKDFVSQGVKYLIVGLVVMTGTFVGSLLFDSLMLKLTGVI